MEVSEKLPIFALSEHLFWLSGQNPERAGLYDTALGARHHDNYSIFKNHPARGGFLSFIYSLKFGEERGIAGHITFYRNMFATFEDKNLKSLFANLEISFNSKDK